jgi:hypothetical protein
MEQLSLSLLDLPNPHAAIWEALAQEQRVVVIEALARLLAKAAGAEAQQERADE